MGRKHVAGVIIEKNNKILLHRRNYYPGQGKLDLVGGYIEKNETPEQTAIREAREETGYNIQLLDKIIDEDYFDHQPKHCHLYKARILSGNKNNSTEGRPVWIKIAKISKEILAFPHTNQFIKKYLTQRKK